jgi:MFS family permease
MNLVLRALILADLFILGGFGLVQPIFAVYMLQNLGGATVASVGVALTVQLFVKAVFQILVGKWGDEEKGNKRELLCLLAGSILISFVPIGFVFAKNVGHVYLIQALFGFGQALNYPSWRVMFSRYTLHDKAGYQWGVYDTVVSLATAASAALGGFIAQSYSFHYLFLLVSFLSFIGTGFIVHIFKHEFTRESRKSSK